MENSIDYFNYFNYFFRGIKELPPYSFRHQMSLTREIEVFKQRVNEADVAPNVDAAE